MISVLTALIGGEIKFRDTAVSTPASAPLSVGEVVDATVTGKQNGKFIINVKGTSLIASSNLPLDEGQKIAVRISQLQPKIVMVPLNCALEVTDGEKQLLDHLMQFKQDPAMLEVIFNAGKEILSPSQIKKYQQLMPESDFHAISERFESLLVSKDTLGEYADKLGLLHEHAIAQGKGTTDNLKSLLIKLQDDIGRVVSEKVGVAKELSALSEFVSSSINKIETYQAVNVMSLGKDGPLLLPFPLLFKDEIRTGEFYASSKETSAGRELRAVLFMDMDNLGKIMAEARLSGGGMRCFLRCENPETRDFLAERISGLKDGLDALGYKTGDIGCYYERNMDAARKDLLEEFPAYSEGVLNIRI
ncbi:MAG: flagellar hook-length control protein FliK [Syntrophales bacterium]|nr:flagellar hook-length control protein FliK [Syntrophales bacterium]